MTTPFSSGQFKPETWASGNSNSNTQDSSSQLALGSAGDIGLSGAWKCSVCKVAFDSGQSFADHLEELQKAKHKLAEQRKLDKARVFGEPRDRVYDEDAVKAMVEGSYWDDSDDEDRPGKERQGPAE